MSYGFLFLSCWFVFVFPFNYDGRCTCFNRIQFHWPIHWCSELHVWICISFFVQSMNLILKATVKEEISFCGLWFSTANVLQCGNWAVGLRVTLQLRWTGMFPALKAPRCRSLQAQAIHPPLNVTGPASATRRAKSITLVNGNFVIDFV